MITPDKMQSVFIMKFFEQLIDNIIKAKSFVLEHSIYGILFSFTVLFIIHKMNPNYFKSEKEKRGSAILSYIFGLTIIFMFSMGYFNIKTSKNNSKMIKAIVLKKSKNTRYGTKYLKLGINDRIERFQPNVKEWEAINERDTINLIVSKGKLGYQHILKFVNYK